MSDRVRWNGGGKLEDWLGSLQKRWAGTAATEGADLRDKQWGAGSLGVRVRGPLGPGVRCVSYLFIMY